MQSILRASGWIEGRTEYKAANNKMLPIFTEFTIGNPEDPEIIMVLLQQQFKDHYLLVIKWATSLSKYYHDRSSAELITQALMMEK